MIGVGAKVGFSGRENICRDAGVQGQGATVSQLCGWREWACVGQWWQMGQGGEQAADHEGPCRPHQRLGLHPWAVGITQGF